MLHLQRYPRSPRRVHPHRRPQQCTRTEQKRARAVHGRVDRRRAAAHRSRGTSTPPFRAASAHQKPPATACHLCTRFRPHRGTARAFPHRPRAVKNRRDVPTGQQHRSRMRTDQRQHDARRSAIAPNSPLGNHGTLGVPHGSGSGGQDAPKGSPQQQPSRRLYLHATHWAQDRIFWLSRSDDGSWRGSGGWNHKDCVQSRDVPRLGSLRRDRGGRRRMGYRMDSCMRYREIPCVVSPTSTSRALP